MFTIYRQMIIYLKNVYDLFSNNFEIKIGKKEASKFSKEKKELIKLLSPYNTIRNKIGGHFILILLLLMK